MNTRDLVFQMTDGRTSINQIHNLLVACGRDHDEVMAAVLEIAGSPDYSRRVIRSTYLHERDEEVGLDEIVFALRD